MAMNLDNNDEALASDALFHGCIVEVCIPVSPYSEVLASPESILEAKRREFVFHDENLQTYILIRLPEEYCADPQLTPSAIANFFSNLDVQVEASFVDLGAATPSNIHRISSRMESNGSGSPRNLPNRPPSSPGLMQLSKNTPPVKALNEPIPFFAQTYNPRGKQVPIVFQKNASWCCLFPMSIPIASLRGRVQSLAININVTIAYRILHKSDMVDKASEQTEEKNIDAYNLEEFNTVNLLDGLREDPAFSGENMPIHRVPAEFHRNSVGVSSPTFTQAISRNVQKTLPVRQAALLRMRTKGVSPVERTLFMFVELENNEINECDFEVQEIEVQIVNGTLTRISAEDIQLPTKINPAERLTFLYNVTLLASNMTATPTSPNSSRPSSIVPPARTSSRRASISSIFSTASPISEPSNIHRVEITVIGVPLVEGSKHSISPIRMRWTYTLDTSGIHQQSRPDSLASQGRQALPDNGGGGRPRASIRESTISRSIVASSDQGSNRPASMSSIGRAGTVDSRDDSLPDGLYVTFSVDNNPIVGRPFPLKIFIVNQSKHTRRFTAVIPGRRRLPLQNGTGGQPSGRPAIGDDIRGLAYQTPKKITLHMLENEFLQNYHENHLHDSDIMCLENNVNLSPLYPSSCQLLEFSLIAVKEGLHLIPLLYLVDNDTGFAVSLRNILEVYVESQPI
ncbi:uncharacterized protein VTP21DRAFT_534 [Calcarisporiella thermophila]|uniref:uncharacterized protein n=1 Tax=Calcarisporiella thermophila TaxID=911321 RepID=UPI0037430E65